MEYMLDSTLNTIESSQVTDSGLESSAINQSLCTHNQEKNSIQSDVDVNQSLCTTADATDAEVAVLKCNFLVRIHRYEDENLQNQIRTAQLLLDKRTRIRDAIRVEILEKRANMRAYNNEYYAAKMEANAAKSLVRSKRQEIDSVLAVINRWKNAMTVDDIDFAIDQMEHVIQHTTLTSDDEDQYKRDLRRFKNFRTELGSNMGTLEEIRHAVDTIDRNEERIEILKKELRALKEKALKAEAVANSIGRMYQEELQAQFRAADVACQQAYADLNSLKKLLHNKNKNFHQYKKDALAARNYAVRGDIDALQHLCANQVETFMEQWNNDDEFRNDYIRRCAANTRRRLLDGAAHVPHDPLSVSPGDENETDNTTENKIADEMKNTGVVKLTNFGTDNAVEKDSELTENKPTKEEIEWARKAEEMRKEEIVAKLKEQRRIEEKAKATEALERKKRNAEKAQLRAELRARKESELKEKEKEKKLKKKGKKGGGGGDGNINGVEAAGLESSNGAAPEETETKKKTQKRLAHFLSKLVKPKPVPQPLLNKNKKWLKNLVNVVIVVLVTIFMVAVNLLINSDTRYKIPR